MLKLLNKFKQKKKENYVFVDQLSGLSIYDIWLISDKNLFVIAMANRIAEKCNYGEQINYLSPAERVIFIVNTLESEVNNGGISQFLFNSSGNLANEVSAALKSIKAFNTELSYTQLLQLLMTQLPTDRLERNILLDKLITEDIEDRFEMFDQWFNQNNENIEELCYSFIMEYKEQFK